MNYLRRLLGDAWLDTEVLGPNPTHPLGCLQKSDPNNAWVPYVEGLVKFIFTDPRINCVAKDLRRKFKAEYTSTVAEMEVGVFLAEQGFVVTFEPSAPKKGPDLLAEREGIPYFVEIREAGFSWDEDRIHRISKEIFAKLDSGPLKLLGGVYDRGCIRANSAQLKAAMAVVVDALELLKGREAEEGDSLLRPSQRKTSESWR